MRAILSMAVLALACGPATADEPSVRLQDGAGREALEAHCAMCHSRVYIAMTSPFVDEKSCQGLVNKMVTVMVAPIPPESVAPIVEYLNKQCGKEAKRMTTTFLAFDQPIAEPEARIEELRYVQEYLAL